MLVFIRVNWRLVVYQYAAKFTSKTNETKRKKTLRSTSIVAVCQRGSVATNAFLQKILQVIREYLNNFKYRGQKK